MKSIIFAQGENIERQYTECLEFAMFNGYETAETVDCMPKAIQRLAKWDIKQVLATTDCFVGYDNNDMEIVRGTLSRYGAKLVII